MPLVTLLSYSRGLQTTIPGPYTSMFAVLTIHIRFAYGAGHAGSTQGRGGNETLEEPHGAPHLLLFAVLLSYAFACVLGFRGAMPPSADAAPASSVQMTDAASWWVPQGMWHLNRLLAEGNSYPLMGGPDPRHRPPGRRGGSRPGRPRNSLFPPDLFGAHERGGPRIAGRFAAPHLLTRKGTEALRVEGMKRSQEGTPGGVTRERAIVRSVT